MQIHCINMRRASLLAAALGTPPISRQVPSQGAGRARALHDVGLPFSCSEHSDDLAAHLPASSVSPPTSAGTDLRP